MSARFALDAKGARKWRTMKHAPRIAIIGAGRLGSTLAVALLQEKYNVVALVARRASHAQAARDEVMNIIAKTMKDKSSGDEATADMTALAIDDLGELPSGDVYLFAVPDDAIREAARLLSQVVAADLSNTKANRPPSQTVKSSKSVKRSPAARIALHTSGARASDELAVLRACGLACGSMHPLISVTRADEGSKSLRDAFFALEGDERAVGFARRVVKSLGAHSFEIALPDKALYHAAAVVTSGHAVALFSLAVEMLKRCGLNEKQSSRILLPLLQSTVENLKRQPPADALTGSFARADTQTIERHLAAIDDADISDARRIYSLLGARSLRLMKNADKPLDGQAVKAIERLCDADKEKVI